MDSHSNMDYVCGARFTVRVTVEIKSAGVKTAPDTYIYIYSQRPLHKSSVYQDHSEIILISFGAKETFPIISNI